jgi:hypothetical protein
MRILLGIGLANSWHHPDIAAEPVLLEIAVQMRDYVLYTSRNFAFREVGNLDANR